MSPHIRLEPFKRKLGSRQPLVHSKLRDATLRGTQQLFEEHPDLQVVLEGPNTKAHLQNRVTFGEHTFRIGRNSHGDAIEVREVPIILSHNDQLGRPQRTRIGTVSWQQYERARRKAAIYAGTVDIPLGSIGHMNLTQISQEMLRRRGGNPNQKELNLGI